MKTHEIELTAYKDWSPTQFDHKGLGCEDQQEWLVVPVILTRDSGCLETSNFECAREMLASADPDGCTWASPSFNHWGPGWIQILLVKPNTHAHRRAQEIAASLASYPILNESDLSERELEQESECWEAYGAKEFTEQLAKHFDLSGNAVDLLENIDSDWHYEWFRELGNDVESGDEPRFIYRKQGWTREAMADMLWNAKGLKV